MKAGQHLTLFNAAAPPATLTILGWSLVIGSVLFLPALYYLILVFKLPDQKKKNLTAHY